MTGLLIGSLFSGIGLLELGLELAGLGSVAWQCEIDPWCRRVLARHWPAAERFADVRTVCSVRADILCGGFPCQPFSVAGKRRGFDDNRWLWPEFARIIDETRPKIVVAENVPGLRKTGLRRVLGDLAGIGYDAEWTHFRASDIGAPHERNRVWIVATNPDSVKLRNEPGWLDRAARKAAAVVDRHDVANVAYSDGVGRLESARRFAIKRGWPSECGWTLGEIARMDDGSARKLDIGRRRKALGNAVVMPCARLVGRAVVESVEVLQ